MPENTRERIIETVIRLYSQYSYEEISTTQIAEEVGISKGTLYWHFAKKETMFEEAYGFCYKKMVECAQNGIDDNSPAIDCLKHRIKNLADLNRIEPHCMQVMGKYKKPTSPADGPFPNYYDSVSRDIMKYIGKGLRSKEIVDLPEIFLLQTVLFINFGFLDYLSKHPEAYEDESLIDRMIDNLYKSIQP